jgi:uncharacterized protein (TIGR00661 family)
LKKGKKINTPSRKPGILVAPMDWGLGHATRCIPIIKELLLQNCEVFIAADGAAESLLRAEFAQATFLPLKGYHLRFSSTKFLRFRLFVQLPRLILTVFNEYRWLKKIIKEHEIDAIISDNRFGLYSNKIICIYITHQLLIKTGSSFTGKIVQKIHYFFISKYKECWIPDFRDNGLAGDLSHPVTLPRNVKYIGALSRFEKLTNIKKKYDLLILLSGPEPQRSIFENMILRNLKNMNANVLLVRGLPGTTETVICNNHSVKILNHLSAGELNFAMQQSAIIISRSGYTTIMDLVKIQQKAILIPTPGQTEQEYLACHLQEKNIIFAVEQENFSLPEALIDSEDFCFNFPATNMEQYKDAIAEFVQSLILI